MTAEFSVEPGEHTLAVSMDWVRSRPFRAVVEPGSRMELVAEARSGWAWKGFFLQFLTFLAWQTSMYELQRRMPVIKEHWLVGSAVSLLVFAAFAAIFAGYVLVTRRFGGDYWALFTLAPAESSSSR